MAQMPSTGGPPPDPDLQAGIQYLRSGAFDRAEPHFRSAHKRYGDRPDILHFLAVCVSNLGGLAEAEQLWRKALAKDPNEPMLSFNLGIMARRTGRLDEAARRFRDTIRRAPNNIEARLALSGCLLDMERFAAAERELGELVHNLDIIVQQPGGEQAKPMQARARNLLGHVLYRLSRGEDALEVLDRALGDAGEDAARRAQIMGDRALALGWLGRHDEAVAQATQALALLPQSAGLNHVLGFVLHFGGRSTDAIDLLRKAIELDPNFAAAFNTLALAQAASGKTDDAVSTLRGAIARNAADRAAILQLANLQIERGEFGPAAETVAPWLKQVPDDAEMLNYQGLALHGLKQLDEAHKVLKRASRLSNNDAFVLTNLGRVLVDLGRPAEGQPLHEQALKIMPGDARLLLNYGVCLAALGVRDKARETLDAVLANDPGNDRALKARAGLDA